MDITVEQKQRRKFKDILFELAESQEIFENATKRSEKYIELENLYCSNNSEEKFRHYYSDIFSVLTAVQQDEKMSMEVLGQNLLILMKGYRPQNDNGKGEKIDISNNLRKLYDHVNLDIARINYSDKADRELLKKDNLKEVYNNIKNVETKTDGIRNNLSLVENNLKNVQKEYVAILGILASVIIAFTAGIVFSTSVLENMHESSIYRILLISLLIGIVLSNLLFLLLYYIDKIVNNNKNKNMNILCIVNGILLSLMVVVTICWNFGLVERRNINLNGKFESEIERIDEIDSLSTSVPISTSFPDEMFKIEENID